MELIHVSFFNSDLVEDWVPNMGFNMLANS